MKTIENLELQLDKCHEEIEKLYQENKKLKEQLKQYDEIIDYKDDVIDGAMKELKTEKQIKKDILKAWKEDIEKYEEWLKRERKEKESIVNWHKKY